MTHNNQCVGSRAALDRIVLINDAINAKGGATGLALELARLLAERGRRVTYVTGAGEGNPELEAAGIEVVALGELPLLQRPAARRLTTGLYHPGAERLLSSWIARNDTPGTVYHVHGWSQVLSPSIFRALRPVGARLVVHAHDFFMVCPNGGFMNFRTGQSCQLVPNSLECLRTHCDRRSYPQKLWRSGRHFVLDQLFPRRATPGNLVVIQEGMVERFTRLGVPPDRVHALPNPVRPFTDFRVPAEANASALFVGRLKEEKGVIDAAGATKEAGMALTIVGDGPLRSELERDFPNVTVMGWRRPEEIGEIAAGARMLLVPSRYPEPFGLVIAEAARSGLPVLLTETALLAPDVERLGFGRALDTRDLPTFAKLLRELMKDDAAVEAMSHAGFMRAREIASTPEQWVDKIEDLYAGLLMGSREV